MYTSAILMIVSGVVTGILCALYIFQPTRIEPLVDKFAKEDGSNWESVSQVVQFFISLFTGCSIVGIVFGGISLRFCTYSSVDFYQKKSVVLTVAIICTLVVNPVVGALYIVAILLKDDNLRFDDEEDEQTQKEIDIDKVLEKLEKLKRMKEQNIINEDEFEKLKSEIIKGTSLDKKASE